MTFGDMDFCAILNPYDVPCLPLNFVSLILNHPVYDGCYQCICAVTVAEKRIWMSEAFCKRGRKRLESESVI